MDYYFEALVLIPKQHKKNVYSYVVKLITPYRTKENVQFNPFKDNEPKWSFANMEIDLWKVEDVKQSNQCILYQMQLLHLMVYGDRLMIFKIS
ncbi:hypothetical protein A7975_18235 [Bacillus sp. FJAT-26390]|nr:hypothetical protein A7975_18235 [Bacillus sp. FJAT-26390]